MALNESNTGMGSKVFHAPVSPTVQGTEDVLTYLDEFKYTGNMLPVP